MANYYFDYGIQRTKGEDPVSDIFFFDEEKYETKGGKPISRLQIVAAFRRSLIERMKKEGKNYIRIIHSSNPEVLKTKIFPSATNSDGYKMYLCELAKEKTDSLTCSSYLVRLGEMSPEHLNGFGLIGFTSSSDGTPLFEDRYLYRVNTKKKIELEYKITEDYGTQIKVLSDFRARQVLKGVNLHLGISDGPSYKFGQVFEMKKETFYDIFKNGGTEVRLSDYVSDAGKIRKSGKYCSLIFDNRNETTKKYSKYLILKNETDYDFRGRKDTVEKFRGNTICPFCLRQNRTLGFFDSPRGNYRHSLGKENHSISGINIVSDDNTDSRNFAPLHGYVLCDPMTKTAGDDSARTKFYFAVPEKFRRNNRNSVIIGIYGEQGSGKTVYLSSLLGIQDGYKTDLGYFNAHMQYALGTKASFHIDEIEKVEKKKRSAGGREYYSLSSINFQSYEYDSDNANLTRALRSTANKPKYEQFRYTVERDDANDSLLVRASSQTSTNTRFLPFFLNSDPLELCITDIAGESCSESVHSTSGQESLLTYSNGLIVFIKPKDFSADRQKDTDNIWKKILTAVEHNKQTPVAVVLTKFDSFIEASSEDEILNQYIDTGSWCLSQDCFDMLKEYHDRKQNFESSEINKMINKSSSEICGFIRDKYRGSLPSDIDLNKIENLKFFAISSFGKPDMDRKFSYRTKDDDISVLSTPYNLTLPIIWILHVLGFVEKGGKYDK